MRTLEQRLAAIKAASAKRIPGDTQALMHRAVDELIATGQHERAVGEGDQAPVFSLPNSEGEVVELAAWLSRGPAVVTFFRGYW